MSVFLTGASGLLPLCLASNGCLVTICQMDEFILMPVGSTLTEWSMGYTKIYLACRVPGTQQIKFFSVPFQLGCFLGYL